MGGAVARQSADAAPAARAPEPGRSHERRRVQTALKLSDPGDAAEREAVATARAVMRMPDPVVPARARVPMLAARAPAAAAPAPKARKDEVSPELTAEIKSQVGGGRPLSADTRSFLEPRFKANFAGVRVHTGGKAENLATRLGARAFTFGKDIFFNAGAYKPDSPEGMELIAHELTHTIQQQEVVQRDVVQREEAVTVQQRGEPHVQRGIVGEALDWIADKANIIPGFRLFTIIIGRNPINMSAVDRSGANILRALIEFIPGGGLIVQALENHGIFEKGGKFIEEQFAALRNLGGAVRDALMEFIDSLGWRDIFRLGSLWDRAKRIFTTPIDKAIAFGKGLVTGIATLVKDAIIKPLGRWAATNIPKWDLLVGVFGKNPISDEGESPASALIGAFMELIGQKEIWENIKKGNAVAKAWAWFQGAMKGALSLVTSIPGRVMSTIRSLTIFDIVTLVGAFQKIVGAFSSFVGDFMRWAGGTVLQLLEIILSVVAPSVIPYLKKAGGAFSSIIKNPIGFVRTLVRAGIQGFRQFARNFLQHLKASLIGWLTGALGGAGIYIPSGFTLIEILKFVLSVMGLTWANVRAKLVKATNETVVKALETGFDIVKTLVTEGPAAAWQKIVETLTNLKQMAIDAVMDFVKSKVIEAAVTKLLSMLNPAGAFIQAIIAIYNTIMFFVERIRQIAQVAAAFIDGIAAIAAGNIAPAANKVEQTMAGLLTLVISFLARIAGLGKVSDAVLGLVKKIRDPIDKALDKVVAWIVETAKKLGKMAKDGVNTVIDWWKAKFGFTNKDGESHTLQFIGSGPNSKLGIATTLMPIRDYLDAHPDKGKPNWAAADTAYKAAETIVFSTAKKTEKEAADRKKVADAMAKMGAAFAALAGDAPKDPTDYGSTSALRTGMAAGYDVIFGKAPSGGTPTGKWPTDPAKGQHWIDIFDAGLTTVGDKWVQMHIVTAGLGGKGTDFNNLIPAPNSVNTGPFLQFEQAVVKLPAGKSGKIKNRVWVDITVSGSMAAPTGIAGKAGVYLWKGSKKGGWEKDTKPAVSVSAGIPAIPKKGDKRKFLINYIGKTEMRQKPINLDRNVAAKVYENRPYGNSAEVTSKLTGKLTPKEIAFVLGKGPAYGRD